MYSGPVIDCDVHHARNTDDELIPYLSKGWREYVTDRGPAGNVPLTVQAGFPNPHGFMRADTYPEDGGEPGGDFETMRSQLLDASDVRRAILTFGDDSHVAGHHNPYFAAELARAINDWSIDRWLSKDGRLCSSIMVASQLPDVAAAEIRRHAANPRMVQAMLVDNPFNRGFGHPVFHPISAMDRDRPAGRDPWRSRGLGEPAEHRRRQREHVLRDARAVAASHPDAPGELHRARRVREVSRAAPRPHRGWFGLDPEPAVALRHRVQGTSA